MSTRSASFEELALRRIDKHSEKQTEYLQEKFGEFVSQCESTADQLWRRSSTMLSQVNKFQASTMETLDIGVKAAVSTEVARLNAEFFRLQGQTTRRIDDHLSAQSTSLHRQLDQFKETSLSRIEDRMNALSTKASATYDDVDENVAPTAGYHLRKQADF